MEESVIQQHLTHYKQATETAREELAVLQAKHTNLQSQVYTVYSLAIQGVLDGQALCEIITRFILTVLGKPIQSCISGRDFEELKGCYR